MEVTSEMMPARFLYERCRVLFITYPLAANAANDGSTISSMVLALQEGRDTKYFLLACACGGSNASYSICSWPTGTAVNIQAGKDTPVPVVFASALTHGVPVPRDGSLFGWIHGNVVTALIAVYTEYAPSSPEPCWSVMPLAGSPEAEWPPFTGEPLIGNWFWEFHQSGKIVSVEGIIAATTDTVFWASTEGIFGADCCLVARDVSSPEGYTLPHGRYVYYKVLRSGDPVPSLRELLADSDKADLATRFPPPGNSSWPGTGAEVASMVND